MSCSGYLFLFLAGLPVMTSHRWEGSPHKLTVDGVDVDLEDIPSAYRSNIESILKTGSEAEKRDAMQVVQKFQRPESEKLMRAYADTNSAETAQRALALAQDHFDKHLDHTLNLIVILPPKEHNELRSQAAQLLVRSSSSLDSLETVYGSKHLDNDVRIRAADRIVAMGTPEHICRLVLDSSGPVDVDFRQAVLKRLLQEHSHDLHSVDLKKLAASFELGLENRQAAAALLAKQLGDERFLPPCRDVSEVLGHPFADDITDDLLARAVLDNERCAALIHVVVDNAAVSQELAVEASRRILANPTSGYNLYLILSRFKAMQILKQGGVDDVPREAARQLAAMARRDPATGVKSAGLGLMEAVESKSLLGEEAWTEAVEATLVLGSQLLQVPGGAKIGDGDVVVIALGSVAAMKEGAGLESDLQSLRRRAFESLARLGEFDGTNYAAAIMYHLVLHSLQDKALKERADTIIRQHGGQLGVAHAMSELIKTLNELEALRKKKAAEAAGESKPVD